MNVSLDKSKTLRYLLLPVALLLVAATALAAMTEHRLQIVLEEVDGKWCPKEVLDTGDSCASGNKKNVCAKKNDTIEWQSVRRVNDNYQESTDAFELFFDPFVGTPHKGNNGNYSKKLDAKIPVDVNYKYTVLMDGCPDQPLDPHIIISN